MSNAESDSLSVVLETGVIQLKVNQAKEWSIEALLDVAQRRNPKRAFLFVSKVLGRHIPQRPQLIRKAFTDLADQIPADVAQPVLIMGMAETAVGLAAGVHQAYTARTHVPSLLITTTRHPLDEAILCEFEEEHSHATKHFIHIPRDLKLKEHLYQAKTLVMVDDEATTGKTFFNLYHALKKAGLQQIETIITVTLTDWSNGEIINKLPEIKENISLLHGQWRWQPNKEAPALELPKITTQPKALQPLNQHKDRWGRLGVLDNNTLLLKAKPVQKHERILVLGSSEYVWQPFLLAEQLANEGADVRFSSITRSPIAIGHAIKCAMSFSDNYGINVPLFVYNVESSAYDRVILCSETPLSAWDSSFIAQIPNLEFVG